MIDQVASLTDASAVAWHARLVVIGAASSVSSGRSPCGPAMWCGSGALSEPLTLDAAALAALPTLSATTGACCLARSTACWVFSCTRGSLLHPVDGAHDLVVALPPRTGSEHVAEPEGDEQHQLLHGPFPSCWHQCGHAGVGRATRRLTRRTPQGARYPSRRVGPQP